MALGLLTGRTIYLDAHSAQHLPKFNFQNRMKIRTVKRPHNGQGFVTHNLYSLAQGEKGKLKIVLVLNAERLHHERLRKSSNGSLQLNVCAGVGYPSRQSKPRFAVGPGKKAMRSSGHEITFFENTAFPILS
ncbi:MAG TPA: hypothetical protein VGR47_04910 [Terracidiphilus sp.]|nr:hypothetical protein [Terracidiphilus sp.]